MNNFPIESLKQSAVTSLIAISIPLIQIISFILGSFLKALSLQTIFVRSEFLPLLNALIILVILGGIGALWHWREKQTQINWKKDDQTASNYLNQEKNVHDAFLKLTIGAAVSAISFIAVTILGPAQDIFLAISQYVAYFLSLTLGGLALYLGVREYSKKVDFENQQNLVANLKVALRENGILPDPVLTIIQNKPSDGSSLSKELRVMIDGKEHQLNVRFDGREIYSDTIVKQS